MFDLTRRMTFDALDGWLHELRSKAPEHAPVVLVGNKCDCESIAVTHQEATRWAAQHGMAYLQTSAKSGARTTPCLTRPTPSPPLRPHATSCALPSPAPSRDQSPPLPCALPSSASAGIRINDAFVTLVAAAVGRSGEVAALIDRAKVTQGGSTGQSPGRAEVGIVPLTGRASSSGSQGGCAC